MDFPMLYMTRVTPGVFLCSEDVRSMDELEHPWVKRYPKHLSNINRGSWQLQVIQTHEDTFWTFLDYFINRFCSLH